MRKENLAVFGEENKKRMTVESASPGCGFPVGFCFFFSFPATYTYLSLLSWVYVDIILYTQVGFGTRVEETLQMRGPPEASFLLKVLSQVARELFRVLAHGRWLHSGSLSELSS
jgi:hypothetical protein